MIENKHLNIVINKMFHVKHFIYFEDAPFEWGWGDVVFKCIMSIGRLRDDYSFKKNKKKKE